MVKGLAGQEDFRGGARRWGVGSVHWGMLGVGYKFAKLFTLMD